MHDAVSPTDNRTLESELEFAGALGPENLALLWPF